ncbi:MAG: Fibronectin, type domain protein [Cyanobacteria bacterium RYN_339]|nr:Fibronectin, type domain protein [Cyanobacteria bacterium RYN_339]
MRSPHIHVNQLMRGLLSSGLILSSLSGCFLKSPAQTSNAKLGTPPTASKPDTAAAAGASRGSDLPPASLTQLDTRRFTASKPSIPQGAYARVFAGNFTSTSKSDAAAAPLTSSKFGLLDAGGDNVAPVWSIVYHYIHTEANANDDVDPNKEHNSELKVWFTDIAQQGVTPTGVDPSSVGCTVHGFPTITDHAQPFNPATGLFMDTFKFVPNTLTAAPLYFDVHASDRAGNVAKVSVYSIYMFFHRWFTPELTTQNTCQITIKNDDTQPWTLKVLDLNGASLGTIATGPGDKDVTWDGTVGGTMLYGKYLLDAAGPTRNGGRWDASNPVTVGAYQIVKSPISFSPNGDHEDDTAHIEIKAPDTWDLSVDGYGKIADSSVATATDANSHVMSYEWDGNYNGNSLDDGKYTLRVTPQGAQPSANDPTVDILIKANKLTVGTPPAATGAFSPDRPNKPSSSTKKTINLNVTARNNWKITTPDPANPNNTIIVKQGPGAPNMQVIPWVGDTNGNGIILKDGKYTLRLIPKGLSPSSSDPTAEVTIDTQGPTFALTVDGKEHPDIIDNQVPLIKAVLEKDLSGFDGINSVTSFKFSKRQDNKDLKINEDHKKFDDQNKTFTYKVPVDADSILFGGDQSVEIEIQDRAGNTTKKKLPFAIGEHTLVAGGNLTDSIAASGLPTSTSSVAYSLLGATPDVYDNPLLEKYKSAQFKITVLDPDPAIGPELPPGEAVPITEPGLPPRIFPYISRSLGFFALFVITNSISGDTVSYVYGSDEEKTIRKLIKKGRYFRVDYDNFDGIDFIEADSETYRHVENQRGHNEVGPTLFATALYKAWKATKIKESDNPVELWKNPNPKPVSNGRALKSDRLLVIKYGNHIFQLIVQNKAISGLYIRTAFASGRHPGEVTFPTLQRQWFGVVKKVAKYKASANPGLWFDTEQNPQYPLWTVGEIIDDGVKPYLIAFPAKKAIPRPDRIISPR